MRRSFHQTILGLNFAVALAAQGQGTFQNLDFEAAQMVAIPGDPNGAVQFGAAFPGWTGYISGQVQATTLPNGVPIGPPGQIPAFIAILVPPGWSSWQGTYSLGFGGSGSLAPVAIGQTGIVPPDARSLRFMALYAPEVFLNGQLQATIPLGSGPSVSTSFGIDVVGYASQTIELRFQPLIGINYLDDIRFSNQSIPEPSMFGLFALGAMAFVWGRFNRPVRR